MYVNKEDTTEIWIWYDDLVSNYAVESSVIASIFKWNLAYCFCRISQIGWIH